MIAGQQNRPAGDAADLLGPGRLDERLRDDHLSGDAIDRVEEAVAVREHHDLARLAVDRQIAEHRHLRRVPVVDVVRGELVVPLQLAGVRVERDERRGEEVVAFAIGAVVVGARVAGAIEDEILLGIVGPGHPDRSSAAQVRVTLRPGVAALFSRPGHGVEPPHLLAGLRVERFDETADAVLGAGDADDHLVLDDERRDRRRIPDLVVFERDVIHDAAGLHVEGEQVRVDGRHEQAIAEHGEAAVDRAAAVVQILREVRR